MQIFRKRSRSDEVLNQESLKHGHVCWVSVDGSRHRAEFIYDGHTRSLLSKEQFLDLRRRRAAENRSRFSSHFSRQHKERIPAFVH